MLVPLPVLLIICAILCNLITVMMPGTQPPAVAGTAQDMSLMQIVQFQAQQMQQLLETVNKLLTSQAEASAATTASQTQQQPVYVPPFATTMQKQSGGTSIARSSTRTSKHIQYKVMLENLTFCPLSVLVSTGCSLSCSLPNVQKM